MQKKLIYIWDAYCGWCYGFDSILLSFLEKHPELDIHTLSGGLFTGNRVTSVGNLDFISKANESITKLMGTEFGDPYKKILLEGTQVMNSEHPAAIYASLRPYLNDIRQVNFIYDIQQSFFQKGLSLSNSATYYSLVKKYKLDDIFTEQKIQNILTSKVGAKEDFQQAHKLGVQGFPTVLLIIDKHVFDLRQSAMSSEQLESNYKRIIQLNDE